MTLKNPPKQKLATISPQLVKDINRLAQKYSDQKANGEHTITPSLKRQLLQHWRDEVRHWPELARLEWLRAKFGEVALGDAEQKRQVRKLEKLEVKKRNEMHGAWLLAWGIEGIDLPRGDNVKMKRPRRGRVPSHYPRRWTPPQNLADETDLDLKWISPSLLDAQRSPSAIAIERIEMRQGVEPRHAGREQYVGL